MTTGFPNYSLNPANNTNIGGFFTGEGMQPGDIDDVIRQLASDAAAYAQSRDAAIAAIAASGIASVKYDTVASMNADLAHDAGTIAFVYADSTPSHNDIYAKSGASGSGSWSATGLLGAMVNALVAPTNALATTAALDAENAANGTLSLQASLAALGNSSQFWKITPAQLFQDSAGTVPVTAVGQPVGLIVPLGGTAASDFCLHTADANRGTYRVDEAGNGYIEMIGAQFYGTAATLALKTNTMLSMCFARHADTTSDAMLFADASTNSLKMSFVAGSSQPQITSSRAGSFAKPYGRYATLPIATPLVIDMLLTQGVTSSWQNNGDRNNPATPGLDSGALRSAANTWLDTDNFTGSQITLNYPNNGSIRFYGGAIVYDAPVSFFNRKAINRWVMKQARLDELGALVFDKFIFFGQSNMEGQGDQSTSIAVPFGQGAEYADSGFLLPLKDPIQHLQPDQYSNTGSLIPAFAKGWFDATGRPICAIGAARTTEGLLSGPYGGWLASTAYLKASLEAKVKHCMADVKGELKGACYYGGENDATSGVAFTQASYTASLLTLRDWLRQVTNISDLPLIIFSLDSTDDATAEVKYTTIRAAMVDAATHEGVYLVPYQNYLGQGKHLGAGNVHINQSALNDYGARGAAVAAAALL